MIRTVALAPIRLLLGLPATYGMTLGNRVLQIGRALGLYRGPIHFRGTVRPLNIGGKTNLLTGA